MIDTIEKLQNKFEEVYVLEDPGIIKMICASIIGTQVGDIPIWLMFVAPSGGGKSELISSLYDVKFPSQKKMVYIISELTSNTFISGLQRTGQETSFLHSMPNIGSILLFKDFTSMLSLGSEEKAKIFAQLREIYDGYYSKRTGNGGGDEKSQWEGKIGAIAASTEVVYQNAGSLSSAMGDRFIMYQMKQPDRIEAARRAMQNKHKIKALRADLKVSMNEYMQYIFKHIKGFDFTEHRKNEEYIEKILHVADLATKVRSGVFMDFQEKNITFVPSPEMPTRMIEQLSTIGDALYLMGKLKPENKDNPDYKLENEDISFLFKVAFSSIPIKRRMALRVLAKYSEGATTGGVGVTLGYESNVVGKWLAELMGLGVVTRYLQQGRGYVWKLKKEYAEIIRKHEGITLEQGMFHSDDDIHGGEDSGSYSDGAEYGEMDWGGL